MELLTLKILKECSLDKRAAFGVLAGVMANIRGFYSPKLPLLKESFTRLTTRIKHEIPDVYEKFSSFGISVSIFATRWYLGNYLSFGNFGASHILDIFLLVGFEAIDLIGLEMLYSTREDILSANDISSILMILNSMPTNVNLNEVFRNAYERSRISFA